MVDKEVVLETIKKMYESGIEDSVVEQTLQDIGLGPAQIREYVAEAKGDEVSEDERDEAETEAKPLETRRQAAEEKIDHAAMHATTHVALEEQSATLAELLEKLGSLEKKLSFQGGAKQMPDSIISVNQRLGAMEKRLSEIQAGLAATKEIMEKILETDRKTLNKL